MIQLIQLAALLVLLISAIVTPILCYVLCSYCEKIAKRIESMERMMRDGR